MVFALPRGGVPVAYEVAKALKAPPDLFLVRALAVPGHEELVMGAIASGGARILNSSIIRQLQITDEAIEQVIIDEQRELRRCEQDYREEIPEPQIEGKTVILVNDGRATGASMWATVVALREQKPQ